MRRNTSLEYIERRYGMEVKLDVDLVTKVMQAINIKPNIDTQGSQTYFKGRSLIVDIWL